MEARLVLAVLFVLFGLWFIARLVMRERAADVWANVAKRFDLQADGLHVHGTTREVHVEMVTEMRGSRKNGSEYTVIRSSLDPNVVPRELHIEHEGMFSKIGKALGGQDVQLGMPELDGQLRIRAMDETAARAWASRGDVAQGLQDILDLCLTFHIETHQVTLEALGVVRDEQRLNDMMEQMVRASRAFSGLGYSPKADE